MILRAILISLRNRSTVLLSAAISGLMSLRATSSLSLVSWAR